MCAALSALSASPTAANPAGPNGLIAFGRYAPSLDDTVLHTINSDGSGITQATRTVTPELDPEWAVMA